MPVIETALTRLLAIEHPILLAPMGRQQGASLRPQLPTPATLVWSARAELAEATTIRRELSDAGNARVGVGFITWALEQKPEALDVALDARPAAVMLSFGDPTPFTERIRAAGCKIICQVIAVAAAGGIADGRGLAAALALGAASISKGTRFTTSRESLVRSGDERCHP